MAKFYAIAPNGDSAVLSISLQNMDQSLQQNGWCKLPNGLIIQWEPNKNFVGYMLDLFCKMISRMAYNARHGKLHVEESGTQTKSSCKVDLEKRAWYDMNFGFLDDNCDMIVTKSGAN